MNRQFSPEVYRALHELSDASPLPPPFERLSIGTGDLQDVASLAMRQRRRPVLISLYAGAAIVGVLALIAFDRDGKDRTVTVVPASADAEGGSSSSTAITTLPIVIGADPGIVKTTLVHAISKGNTGDDVTALQQRLADLGFDPGPIDGIFGSGTQQAVWAYEKLVLKTPRADAKGRVTNEMWQVMQDRITIAPRRPTGPGSTHMEIYVPEQVAIVFRDDVPELIAHISTGIQNPDGTPQKWCETLTYDTGATGEPLDTPVTKAECADAKTPGGVFRFTRRYDGKRTGPLGGMMNPVYFNYGIAVHGADNVPLEPASHGCVRLNQTIAKVFPSMVKTGDLVYVWAQDGKEPEQYTRQESLPSFNYADPDATTTTESTTTTIAPETTPAPTSTTTPATTTTEAANTTTTTV